MAARVYLALALLLTVALQQGNAIKCWRCQSDKTTECGTPFVNTTFSLFDCNQELHKNAGIPPKFCSKMTTEEHGHTVIYRSCAYNEGLCQGVSASGICSTCSTDACNGAPGSRLESAGALAVLGLAAIYFFRF